MNVLMLHYKNDKVKQSIFDGTIGLEKEGLRVTKDGFMAQTQHPFLEDDPYIVRDFCENQTEINTEPKRCVDDAYNELLKQTNRIKDVLSKMDEPEYLWPFSNPPFIKDEDNIPIAQYKGKYHEKTIYREYLAKRYGRYKLTFSGIHFNYSFDEELLKEEFALSDESDYLTFKNKFYVSLAASAYVYNWLVVAITAASPLLDSSYFEKGRYGNDVFNGMASSRCSDIGYWNLFTPVLDYMDLQSYEASIDYIIDKGLIRAYGELYLPVRVKTIPKNGRNEVSHIELRMIDLNPLDEAGIDKRDVKFLQMFLVFLACKKPVQADIKKQVLAAANTKYAARFDLKTVNITKSDGECLTIADAALDLIDEMISFYDEICGENDCNAINEILLFERSKFTDIENRYAWIIRDRFSGGFVNKGMQYVKNNNI